jgi:hypothetical protein
MYYKFNPGPSHLEKGYLNTEWSATIRNILNQCGIGVIWNNPGTMSPRHLIQVVAQKLKMESRCYSRPEASKLLCD